MKKKIKQIIFHVIMYSFSKYFAIKNLTKTILNASLKTQRQESYILSNTIDVYGFFFHVCCPTQIFIYLEYYSYLCKEIDSASVNRLKFTTL